MSADAGVKSSKSAAKKAVANGVKKDLTGAGEPSGKQDPALAAQVEALRLRLHETLGQALLALSPLPRYRDQTLGDLRAILIEPLLRDRVLIATAKGEDEGSPSKGLVAIAFWASVSEEVDAKIKEQVKARVFPLKLKPEDWTSGDKLWLLDVIAPNMQLASAVLTGFAKRLTTGELSIHPVAAKQVDPGLLKRVQPEI